MDVNKSCDERTVLGRDRAEDSFSGDEEDAVAPGWFIFGSSSLDHCLFV